MTTWLYYTPEGSDSRGAMGQPWQTETVGARELELLLLARSGPAGKVVVLHTRASNAERMAARRLVERGLLRAPYPLGGAPGTWKQERGRISRVWLYELTERGRTCWLRAKKEGEGR